MVEKKVTQRIEKVISGPTKLVDPDATPYDEDITYEKKKVKTTGKKYAVAHHFPLEKLK